MRHSYESITELVYFRGAPLFVDKRHRPPHKVLILGGVQMLTMGVFGECLWRILVLVQRINPFLNEKCFRRFILIP